ncbi:MAG: hypothetical protein GX640_17035 [Fibrobacter sp.]|nr:hypothetical protein [Fibrobacter sp.]
MGNILKMVQQQQIQSLATLGWSDRLISKTIGVDRGTVAKYRKRDKNPPEVPTDSADQNPPNVPTDENSNTSTPLKKLPSTNSEQQIINPLSIYSLFSNQITLPRRSAPL